jgi:maltooligosyltrehalose synthase
MVDLSSLPAGGRWLDVLSGRILHADGKSMSLADLFSALPVALLVHEPPAA